MNLEIHLKTKRLYSLKVVAFSAAMAFLLGATGILTGCGSGNTGTGTQTIPPAKTSIEQKPLTEELVRETAAKRIGDESLIRYATITQEGDKKVISIGLTRPTLCHDGALVGTVANFSQKTVSAMFKYDEVERVEVSMYGTTVDYPPNNELALKIVVDRATNDRIDWFAFDDTTMPQMATSYFVDPRIQANWVVEGGDDTPRSQQTVSTSAS